MLDALASFFGSCLHFWLGHEPDCLNQGGGVQLVNGDGFGAHPHAGAGRPPEGLVAKEGHYCSGAASYQPCRDALILNKSKTSALKAETVFGAWHNIRMQTAGKRLSPAAELPNIQESCLNFGVNSNLKQI